MPEGTESSSHGSNERRTWDKGAGISFFSGGWASRLCSHVWLKQLDWNCAYAGWGMGGPHTSPGKRAGKCGDTGVVPFSTTDSGPNTQAVMGFGGTGHMANGQQQRLDSCTHSARGTRASPLSMGALWCPLPSETCTRVVSSPAFLLDSRAC